MRPDQSYADFMQTEFEQFLRSGQPEEIAQEFFANKFKKTLDNSWGWDLDNALKKAIQDRLLVSFDKVEMPRLVEALLQGVISEMTAIQDTDAVEIAKNRIRKLYGEPVKEISLEDLVEHFKDSEFYEGDVFLEVEEFSSLSFIYLDSNGNHINRKHEASVKICVDTDTGEVNSARVDGKKITDPMRGTLDRLDEILLQLCYRPGAKILDVDDWVHIDLSHYSD